MDQSEGELQARVRGEYDKTECRRLLLEREELDKAEREKLSRERLEWNQKERESAETTNKVA